MHYRYLCLQATVVQLESTSVICIHCSLNQNLAHEVVLDQILDVSQGLHPCAKKNPSLSWTAEKAFFSEIT